MVSIVITDSIINTCKSVAGVPKSGASTSIADITSKFSFGQKRKFDDKSKKKKTYIGRCKRLLNNMLELDDSRPFRTAVDKLKFPVSRKFLYTFFKMLN